MVDELELLKKDWQKKEADLPKLSYDQIYKMIWKKSSSIVKWIFYISLIEFAFWACLNIFFSDAETMQQLKVMHIYTVIMVLNFLNYGVILYFIYKFYINYRKISFTDSSKKLMKTILDVKRTVTQYVWFNLIIFTVSMLISIYGAFAYGPEGAKLMEAAAQDNNTTMFWGLLIVVSLVFIAVLLVLIWLFYKLLYGILLKRLRQNYKDLKKLEV